MNKFLMVLFLFTVVKLSAQNDKSELKNNFQALDDQQNSALVKGDINKFVSFYAEDAVSLPSYMPLMRGKDEIYAGNKKDFESTKYKSLESKTLDVFGSGDIVYEIGTYNIVLRPAGMTEDINDHGKYLTVWQKQADGNWKIKTDTWNSDVNPMNMTQAGAKQKDMDDMKKGGEDK
jgi:uncharacterized protein (TIGR02246 family)